MARVLENGRWVLSRETDFAPWVFWRAWLHRETGRTFFPDKLVVWDEWPPTTPYMAKKVLDTIEAARKEAGHMLPLCREPEHFLARPSLRERDDLDQRHRADMGWVPPLPQSHIPRGHAWKSPDEIRLDAADAERLKKIPPIQRGEKFLDYKARIQGWEKK